MTIDPMLLHNLYINVAIAVILSPKFSLHDLPKPKYKKYDIGAWGVFRKIALQASE